jgi:hypothetical protein
VRRRGRWHGLGRGRARGWHAGTPARDARDAPAPPAHTLPPPPPPPGPPPPASLERRVAHLQQCCRAATERNAGARVNHALLRALVPCQRALQDLLAPSPPAPPTTPLPPSPGSTSSASASTPLGAPPPPDTGPLPRPSSSGAAGAGAPRLDAGLLSEVDAHAAELARLLGRRSVPVTGVDCPPSGLLLWCGARRLTPEAAERASL